VPIGWRHLSFEQQKRLYASRFEAHRARSHESRKGTARPRKTVLRPCHRRRSRRVCFQQRGEKPHFTLKKFWRLFLSLSPASLTVVRNNTAAKTKMIRLTIMKGVCLIACQHRNAAFRIANSTAWRRLNIHSFISGRETPNQFFMSKVATPLTNSSIRRRFFSRWTSDTKAEARRSTSIQSGSDIGSACNRTR